MRKLLLLSFALSVLPAAAETRVETFTPIGQHNDKAYNVEAPYTTECTQTRWTTSYGGIKTNEGKMGSDNYVALFRGVKKGESGPSYIISDSISGGIKNLSFTWNTNGDANCDVDIRIYINNLQIGSITHFADYKQSAPFYTWTKSDINVTGKFVIKFENKTNYEASGNKKRLVIDDLTWETYSTEITTYSLSAKVAQAKDGYSTSCSLNPPSIEVPYGTTITTSGNVLTAGTQTITATANKTKRYTYSFVDWGTVPEKLTNATSVKANFTRTRNSYTITFMNETMVLQSSLVPYDSVPAYVGEIPTKDPDAQYTYTFSGWSPEVDSVRGDQTYMAQFTGSPREDIQIDENATEMAWSAEQRNVTLTRTLAADMYNSICFPFALSADQISDAFGSGTIIQDLVDATVSADETELILTFSEVSQMESGKPYLIKPTQMVVNPSFLNVQLTTTVQPCPFSQVDFIGKFVKSYVAVGNRDVLLLGANNQLGWASGSGNIKGLRAYFKITYANPGNLVSTRMVFGDKSFPSVLSVIDEDVCPTKIMKDGQLIIQINGHHYNTLGQKLYELK